MHFNIKISLQFYVLHLYIKKKKWFWECPSASPDCKKGPWLQKKKKKKWKLSKMAKRGRWGRSLEAGKKSEPVIRELEWEGEGQEWTQSPFPAKTRHLKQCLEHEATKSNFLNEWKMEVAWRQLWGGIYWAGPLSGLMSVEERRVKGVEGVARKLGHSVRSGTGAGVGGWRLAVSCHRGRIYSSSEPPHHLESHTDLKF